MSKTRIVSVHIPRTGGISLWAQLASVFNNFAQDYEHDPLGGSYPSQPWPGDKEIIHGHFRPDRYEGEFYMTWLRYPVDQVISLYSCYCVIAPTHRLIKRFHREKPTVLEFAGWEPVRHLLSETWFGGFSMERFGFIGCFERREAEMIRLGQLLGVSLDAQYNQTIRGPTLTISREDREALASLLEEDIAFYKFTLQR